MHANDEGGDGMKRIYTGDTLAEVGHLRNLLEQSGIQCFIKNEQLSGALGEVPFLECLPELWVLDDADQQAAERHVRDFRNVEVEGGPWRCDRCHEENEAQFAACWNCGRPDAGS
jgi:Putative prokaryotic signal transducing protein